MSTENESGISNALESQKCRRSKPRKYRHRQKITTNIVEKKKKKFKYKEETKNKKYNNTAFSMLFLLYHYHNQLSHEKNIQQKRHGSKLPRHNSAMSPLRVPSRDSNPGPSLRCRLVHHQLNYPLTLRLWQSDGWTELVSLEN